MIRPVKKEDVGECVRLGSRMHKESQYRKLPYGSQKVVDLAYACLFHPDQYLGLVEEREGRIVGMFCGYISSYCFGPSRIASDMVLFVEKKLRGGTTALRFVRAYEAWAKEQKADQVMLGVSTGVDEKRTLALYKRLGYQPFGTTLRKSR